MYVTTQKCGMCSSYSCVAPQKTNIANENTTNKAARKCKLSKFKTAIFVSVSARGDIPDPTATYHTFD